jgi:hypothetical protein
MKVFEFLQSLVVNWKIAAQGRNDVPRNQQTNLKNGIRLSANQSISLSNFALAIAAEILLPKRQKIAAKSATPPKGGVTPKKNVCILTSIS